MLEVTLTFIHLDDIALIISKNSAQKKLEVQNWSISLTWAHLDKK